MAASNTELFTEAQVQITVRYQSTEIFNKNEDCSDGCCVFYKNHTCKDAKLVRLDLPYAGDNDDDKRRKEIECTNRLLKGMENGLLLEYDTKDECIYAKRRCRTVVYYHSSQYHANDDPVKIETNQKVKLFDYPAFQRQFWSWLSQNFGRRKDNRESFKRHKIFFSFGQTWQPYLERHKELGEDRPQPTSLHTRLISMVVVPLKAKEMVMATEEGRESSETISMGLNQNFIFVSLEGSSQICSSLERMAHRIRKLDEQGKERSEEPENMSIDEETTSSFSQLLDDCLDLQDMLKRRNHMFQQQGNPCHHYQQPQKQLEQHHLSPMAQHQLREQQQPMEEHQQVDGRQQMELQFDLIQQQQQNFQRLAFQQQQQQFSPNVPAIGHQEHVSQLLQLQDPGSQLQQDYTEPPLFQLRTQIGLQEPFPDQQPMCQQADNGMVYFNFGDGKEGEVGFTPEEWLKVVSLSNRLMEAENILPNAQ
ncbi:uncharacterized protein LOC117113824 isoform X1 [Anneissia japonica]|uniref:uncharacterized protein LOC117113824 isoform X1 n=1 Tax=Anneissia japonica TaxID=1529436 RepID=UPI0014255BC1|nr:uncharacterized protein LOC117113824 isoform X1 [Anneissia japonica]